MPDLLPRMARLVNAALPLWPLPAGAQARLINQSENLTWLVEAAGVRSVLRLHRPCYHSRRGIEQELAWSQALAAAGVVSTPTPIAGRNGQLVQITPEGGRCMVMFAFAPGRHPDMQDDQRALFRRLGALAARCHLHAQDWAPSQPLERLIWDDAAVFGPRPTWGDWRAAPNLTPQHRALLEPAETLIRRRLAAFGKARARYGLIHADMRLANLLLDGDSIRLIDFDDCGLGWYLYDFAASISFIEDHPQVPALRAAWLTGYRGVRPLPMAEAAEIDTFVMLRRMALLAWIGSHADAPEPRAMAPHFAAGTAALARDYLTRFA